MVGVGGRIKFMVFAGRGMSTGDQFEDDKKLVYYLIDWLKIKLY